MVHPLLTSKELYNILVCYLNSLNNDTILMYVMHSQFKKESTMPLVSWIKRICKLSKCSSSSIIIGAYFLKKINMKHPQLIFSEVNMRRLFFTSVMLAVKVNEDHVFKNIDWVYIGDFTYSIEVINRMESEFLSLLDFEFYVSLMEYNTFCEFLVNNFQLGVCHCNSSTCSVIRPIATTFNSVFDSVPIHTYSLPKSQVFFEPTNPSPVITSSTSPMHITSPESVIKANVISPVSPSLSNGDISNLIVSSSLQRASDQSLLGIEDDLCRCMSNKKYRNESDDDNSIEGDKHC
jgi:hypothetical protein